ncbi:Sad1 / UNC family protein [Entamoeba histolytica HM-3:IMSS]|nr:Sad1 / UNC family protein [Entamoeba histolytica HM-3:IMSS]GAT93045.1 hypothetical protein CL6EHI_096480 [Entamoeba histolytica]
MKLNVSYIVIIISGVIILTGFFLSTEKIFYFYSLKKLHENQYLNSNDSLSMNGQLVDRKNNYASDDCGAKVIATNSKACGSNNLLNSNKDEYYLSPCQDNIHFVVELCQTIQLHQVGIGNFELFSNQLQNLTISCSVDGTYWRVLGEFRLPNQKILHSISIPHPFWCKYIKIHQTSWYGKEYYCSINKFVAYGISSLDELVDDMVETEDVKNNSVNLLDNEHTFAEPSITPIKWSEEEFINESNKPFINLTTKIINSSLNNITIENTTRTFLYKQKMRIHRVELELEVFKGHIDELQKHFVQHILSLNETENVVNKLLTEIKKDISLSFEETKTMNEQLTIFEKENTNQILENQRLSKELLALKNSYHELKLKINTKTQAMFYILLIIACIFFLFIIYWSLMLSRKCTNTLSKTQKLITSKITNISFPPSVSLTKDGTNVNKTLLVQLQKENKIPLIVSSKHP